MKITTITDEHPNNQRNRDMARGCHATYIFLDGRSYKQSFLPRTSWESGLYLREANAPEEVFWCDGKYSAVDPEQRLFFGPDFIMPFHQLKSIELEDFIPVWEFDIPRLPE